MTTKTCNTCKKSKPLDQFQKQPTNSDGRAGRCKDCQSEYQRKRREFLTEHKKMFV